MDIELIRSDRRSLCIEITSDCKVLVRAPRRMPERDINRFIGEKADWIDIHLRKMQKRREEQNKAPETGRALSEQDIRLLTTRAKRVIPSKVRKYAEIIGVDYGRITIRMQKSRWGSCSGQGNLNFNCLLMNAPEEIIDYVVVHELCHRKEMNHSPRFWAEVEKILPDYKNRRRWLKDHGNELGKK
nr:SprT family zinc-dependent metalloprotease [uncultured Butyrivibrio sp.]